MLGHLGLCLRSLSAYDTPKMVRHLRPSWAHAAMRDLAHFGHVLDQLGLSLAEPYNKENFSMSGQAPSEMSLCPSDTSRWTTKFHDFFLLSSSLQLHVRLSGWTFQGQVAIAGEVSVVCAGTFRLIHISC